MPAVERRGVGLNARRRLRLSRLGVPIEWEEEPFEWVRGQRFSVRRRYVGGPVESMDTTLALAPRDGGGTRLAYEVRARPRNALGRVAIPIEIGLRSRRRFADVFRRYDALAGERTAVSPSSVDLAPGGRQRLDAARRALIAAEQPPELVDRLCETVERGDDLVVSRLRPYALAEEWGTARKAALELCLLATRHGLLELRWELLCPLCRGAASVEESLGDVAGAQHCDTCLIDFTAEFDRSVEISFRPARAIREVAAADFCVAGPQVTPHVAAQQLLRGGERRTLTLRLEPGRYRVRTLGSDGARPVVAEDGEPTVVDFENAGEEEQLVLLERTAWSDLAATAAEVTALQVFRDLFATEALRPGEPISVGSLTVVFTDLRGSTRYYREVGDAPAFGSVAEHLTVLREAVAAEDGAVVKAMGDAIMAVFTRPVCAVRAMLAAQGAVAGRPLALKVGIHHGPCIAVTQNGVLDYFGSTVNLAARLVGISTGDDIVLSEAVRCDPEVAELGLELTAVEGTVKGFEDEAPALWQVRA